MNSSTSNKNAPENSKVSKSPSAAQALRQKINDSKQKLINLRDTENA